MKKEKALNLIGNICFLLAFAVLLSLPFFTGCASFRNTPTETKVVMGYESMGAVLETSKPILMAFCVDGTINPDDCTDARKVYNDAVRIYKFLGDIATTAVDTGNDTTYQLVSNRLMELLIEIQHYTGEN